MSNLEKAVEIALEAHKGARDKAGKPYILHPLHVMMQMDDDASKIAAVLHDVVEDSDLAMEDLEKEGFPPESLAAVESLTWRPEEKYWDYINRLRLNPMAVKIKIADLEHNMDMRRIPAPSQKDLERLAKYHRAWVLLTEGRLPPDE